MSLLSKETLIEDDILFILTKNGTIYTINCDCDNKKFNNDHLKQFWFMGKIMEKQFLIGMMLDCYFLRIIYKLITNTHSPILYNSIKLLLDNVFTDKEDNLAYSYDRENTGETKTEDLIKNGGNIKVIEKKILLCTKIV